MTAIISQAATWLDDRCNPILVKEARQAVRSKAVITMLIVALVALLLLTAGTALFQDGSTSTLDGNGLEVFMLINGGIMLLCSIGVPAYVAGKLASESRGASADLLYTTSIGAASIVWGKVAVAMMIALMLLSAAAPYMVVSYLLRGIDLPTIAFVLAIDIVVVLLCSQVAITIAAFPFSTPLRVLGGIIVAPFVLWVGGLGVASVFIAGGSSVTAFDTETWAVLAAIVLTGLGLVALLYTLTVAMLTPEHNDRARLPRVYAAGFWLASLGLAFLVANTVGDAAPVLLWLILWIGLGSAAIMLTSGERRVIGNRLRRKLPRSALTRPFVSLFTSGAATGLLWSSALCVATITAWYVAAPHLSTTLTFDLQYHRFADGVAVIPPYVLALSLLAVWVRDRLLARWLKPGMTLGFAVLFFGIASTVPLVVAAIIDPQNWDYNRVTAVLVPLGALLLGESDSELVERSLYVGGGAAIVMLLFHARWFVRQLTQYKWLEQADDTPASAPPAPDPAFHATPNATPTDPAAPEPNA